MRIATSPSERWFDQSCGMEPRIQLKIQDQQSDWKTKEKMGR